MRLLRKDCPDMCWNCCCSFTAGRHDDNKTCVRRRRGKPRRLPLADHITVSIPFGPPSAKQGRPWPIPLFQLIFTPINCSVSCLFPASTDSFHFIVDHCTTFFLTDWLISRRHCKKDFQKSLDLIRVKVKLAIQDMPQIDEVIQLLKENG